MGGCSAKRCLRGEGDEMNSVATMPSVRGKLTPDAPLAPLVWFKSGGNAQCLFEPKDEDDLAHLLRELDPDVPLMALGSSKRSSVVHPATLRRSARRWTPSRAPARNRNRCAAAPAVRPSRIRAATRPGR